MNKFGAIPSEQRALQQFVAVDRKGGTTTYWRSCAAEPGEIFMVRVPWSSGQEDRSSLTEAERRFVEQNVTPDERAARENVDA
jgi:hypothetical protein